ncbi:hypothetical protein DPMN_171842 [Dreissena polymorpha]|uniref:Uncharacterized protein n=1 Tax=Dreissena polymorpha TaxID=45954 RepID=A0A9D4IE42_DREPO|nr:hypothetical protein DPMN_171842 [Dreissena polymorpha]
MSTLCSVSPISLTISPLSSQVQWSLSFITYHIPTSQTSAVESLPYHLPYPHLAAKCSGVSPISLTISPLSSQSLLYHSPYPHLAAKCNGVSPISLTISPLSSQPSAVESLPYHLPYPHLAAKCSGISPISLTISPLSSQVQWSLSYITHHIPT